jgi:site-specific recombinase XerD
LASRFRICASWTVTAKSLRVIGKGDKERLATAPDSFGRVFAMRLAGKPASEDVFAKAPGGPPMTTRAARIYLKKLVEKAGIENPHHPAQAAAHLRHPAAGEQRPANRYPGLAGA